MSDNPQVCSLNEATDENIEVTCIYNILFTNDMACSQVVNLLYHLRETQGISFQTEQAANRLEKQMKAYEKKMNEVYSVRASFIADANQVIEDAINKDIEELRQIVKGKLIESGCSHPILMTAAEMAHLFIDFAVCNFGNRSRDLDKRKIPVPSNLLYMRLDKLLKPAHEVCTLLFDGNGVNLNNKKAKKAIRRIIKKLTDARLIAKAINVADTLNPAD